MKKTIAQRMIEKKPEFPKPKFVQKLIENLVDAEGALTNAQYYASSSGLTTTATQLQDLKIKVSELYKNFTS